MPASKDKRVYEISARDEDKQVSCLLAISADSTILDLHLALLGAFNWRGDFDAAEYEYRVTIGHRTYERGKGSRTPLRRVLDIGTPVECISSGIRISAEVMKTFEVASRRRHPKVLDIGGNNRGAQAATWRAQSAMRREYRGRAARLADLALRDQGEARRHGYFTAVVSGPLLMPSVWLPRLLELHEFADMSAAQNVAGGIMNEYNAVAHAMHEERDAFVAAVQEFASRGNGAGLLAWCAGYFDAVELCVDQWQSIMQDAEIRELFKPIAITHLECGRDPQKRAWLDDSPFLANLANDCALGAIGLCEAWREHLHAPATPFRRAEPKVAPNAPCPCGSGKKYKRCCGSPLRVVKG